MLKRLLNLWIDHRKKPQMSHLNAPGIFTPKLCAHALVEIAMRWWQSQLLY